MVIQIQVFSNVDALKASKPVFERIIQHDDSVSFPYEKMTDSLRILFSELGRPVVSFNIQ